MSDDTCKFGCQKNSMNQKEDSSYYSYWFDFVAFCGTLSCCNVTVNFVIELNCNIHLAIDADVKSILN